MPSVTLTGISWLVPVVLCIHIIILQESLLFDYEGASDNVALSWIYPRG
jgi:hypothetical protein